HATRRGRADGRPVDPHTAIALGPHRGAVREELLYRPLARAVTAVVENHREERRLAARGHPERSDRRAEHEGTVPDERHDVSRRRGELRAERCAEAPAQAAPTRVEP